MAHLFTPPFQTTLDANANAISGAQLLFYVSGTNTPAQVYADAALTTPLATPVVADSAGRFVPIYLSPLVKYRVVVANASGATIRDVDPISNSDLADLADGGGLGLVGFIAEGAGAVERTALSKARETVSLLDFGVGDETTDDTVKVNEAFATGKDILVPEGYTFSVTSVGATMADGQRVYGGGTIKKRLLGSVYAPADAKSVFILPDASTGIIIDGITIDGNTSVLPAGAPVSAIFAKVPRSLTVRNASLVNLRDCGVKVWSGARITVDNCLIDGAGTGENGVELHNYAIDPNAGVPFPAGLPPVTGDHFITRNRIRHFTRYEPTDGSLIVDATGVNFPAESGAPKHRRVTVTDNEITDCLRGVWTENNYANTEVDGFTIERNTITCGVSGGTAQGIFGKVGIGIIGGKNGLVRGNRLRNVSNHNPTGSTTAGITLSGSAGVTTNGNAEVSGNQIIDDSGLAQRMQVGINVVLGSDIRVHGNFVSGASVTPIYIDPSLAASIDCHSNRGAQDEYSWINPVALTPFVRTAIPASLTDGATYPNNLTFETEIVAHAAGRLVALVSKLDNAFSAGSLIAKVYVNNVEQASLRIIGSDFAGGVIAIKRQAATSGIQVRAGQRIKVTLTTDAAFAPATLNGSFTAILDTGVKQ